MADSKLPHIVAIVSVIATASAAIYAAWDKGRTDVAIEKIKAEAEVQKANKERSWNGKKERCSQIVEASRNLAQAYGNVYQELNLNKRGDMSAHLWAAATMLSAENQKVFLDEYQKHPPKQDDYDAIEKLITIALKGLATDGQKCLANLPQQ